MIADGRRLVRSSSVVPECQRMPRRELAAVGLWQHGDVGDQRAQHALAVLG
ncbi:MAG TPA: hypothetical protein VFA45_04705 [Actinomycetes bacterium]|nr:hypothetical protein [Actinomycetes bacterium]